jgi:hypothetical protein
MRPNPRSGRASIPPDNAPVAFSFGTLLEQEDTVISRGVRCAAAVAARSRCGPHTLTEASANLQLRRADVLDSEPMAGLANSCPSQAPCLFRHVHPVDGVIEIRLSDDVVHASCRWPLDLDANEWTVIAGDFRPEAFRNALQDLERVGHGRATTLRKLGFVEFVTISGGTRIELGDDVPNSSTRLSLNLTEPSNCLAPRLLANLERATTIAAPRRSPDEQTSGLR